MESEPSSWRAGLSLRAARLWFAVWRRLAPRGGVDDDEEEEEPLGLYAPSARVDVALVSLLGLDAAAAERAVARLAVSLGHHHRVVFVVDEPRLLPLLRDGIAFECVPSLADRRTVAADLAWADYMRDWSELLIAKWRPLTTVDVGVPVRLYCDGPPAAAGEERAPR